MKDQYRPNITIIKSYKDELSRIKTKYNEERKKYKEYVENCDNQKIVKIYYEKEKLENDNVEKVFYDDQYDTSKHDVSMYQSLAQNGDSLTPEIIKTKLELLYIFDTEDEINKKYNNILENLENQYQVRKD